MRSVLILILLRNDPLRFNQLRRAIEGISQKMLSQVLKSLERDGLVRRAMYPEVPPRVEYVLTPFGTKFVRIVDELKKLHDEVASGTLEPPKTT